MFVHFVAAAGSVEFKYGSMSDAQSSKLTATTPAILLGTGFWALMQGFAVGQGKNLKYLPAVATAFALTSHQLSSY